MSRLTLARRTAYALLAIDALGVAALGVANAMVPQPRPPLVSVTVPPPAPKPQKVAAVTPKPTPAPYVVKHILPIAGAMRHGDWHWDEAGAPATGETVITVDLAAQVISIFRSGYEIGTAVILYGADDKPTPLGVFAISQKDATHVSNLYHAPMPWMLRLTNDGVSIHGSNVEDGYMTHGCVGVPKPFAAKLFKAVTLGTRVIVTRGETLNLGGAIKAA